MYDNNGIEVHCLRDHMEPKLLTFLPHHFLLATGTKGGYLKYLDVSTGKLICESKTKKGEPTALAQNPYNAIVGMGHSTGEVTFWTPNFGKPVVRMLCHASAPITTLAYEHTGKYMITCAKDSRMKVWDIRSFRTSLYDYFLPSPASASQFAQSSLFAVSFGN